MCKVRPLRCDHTICDERRWRGSSTVLWILFRQFIMYRMLEEHDRLTSAQGTTVVRLTESFRGKRVRGSQVDISLKPDGTVDRLGGRITRGLNQTVPVEEIVCTLNISQLVEIFLQHEGFSPSDVTVQRSGATYKYQIQSTSEPLVLSFLDIVYSLTARPSIYRNIYKIEPCTGTVIDVENRKTYIMAPESLSLPKQASSKKAFLIRQNQGQRRKPCDPPVTGSGGNEKTGMVSYGTEPACLKPITIDSSGTCHLESQYIKVVDLENGTLGDFTQAVEFPCNVGYNDTVNGGYSPSLDTFFHATQWAKMFRAWYSYAPLTNPSPTAYLHFGGILDNAFWDGQNLLLGDGGSETFPYTVLDTVSHELAHGLTERSSGLELRNESGAIAESFSDIVGEVAERYVHRKNDWLVAAELFKLPGQALRYFKDPTDDGVSISHIVNYTEDMNPHYASGLFNKVFYQVSQEIGTRWAFKAFLVANRIYWRETSSFEEAACDVIKGAYDSGLEMRSFVLAFKDIGLQLTECERVNGIILRIRKSETRNNVQVSKVVHPLFRMLPHHDANFRGFTISVDSRVDIRITVTSSPTREPSREITSGMNSVTAELPSGHKIYVRLSSDTKEEVFASMAVTYF